MEKEVKLEFKTIQLGSVVYNYTLFRKTHPYMSVIYVDEGCDVCYSKTFVWYKKWGQLPKDTSLAYVFIFRGRNFDAFRKKAIGEVEFPYYVISDSTFIFTTNNSHIPREIIDNTILLDSKNRICVIGEPFISIQMGELYKMVYTQKFKW